MNVEASLIRLLLAGKVADDELVGRTGFLKVDRMIEGFRPIEGADVISFFTFSP